MEYHLVENIQQYIGFPATCTCHGHYQSQKEIFNILQNLDQAEPLVFNSIGAQETQVLYVNVVLLMGNILKLI